jgi:predicted transcriptional regulator
MTVNEAAEALDVTAQAITYHLRKMGVERKGRDWWISERTFDKLTKRVNQPRKEARRVF